MKHLNKLVWPLVIILLSLSGIFIYEQGREKSVQIIERVEEAKFTNKKLVVQVDGAVKNPGVYQVTENTHLYEILLLAEPLPDADLQKFNLAEVIKDGSLFRIPSTKKEVKKTVKIVTVKKGSVVVNINKAGVNELSQIPGIGISYAESIINYRNEKGYFNELKDLLNVKGIGEAKLKAMEQYITLD
ncbi:MAG: helix-hairpin-helix domain-containing protein [Candidatus Riflemargulisbacteria bacterium]